MRSIKFDELPQKADLRRPAGSIIKGSASLRPPLGEASRVPPTPPTAAPPPSITLGPKDPTK